MRRLTFLVIVVLILSAAPASAQGFLTPFIGVVKDGETSSTTYGLALGALAGGVIGFELDLGFTPNFLGDDVDDSNLVTIMGNLVLAAPLGAVQPYASGGIGLVRFSVSGARDLLDVDSNDFGVNAGGGIKAFFTDSVGVAGDVRYFRSLEKQPGLFDFALGTLDYWRVSGGVTFRF